MIFDFREEFGQICQKVKDGANIYFFGCGKHFEDLRKLYLDFADINLEDYTFAFLDNDLSKQGQEFYGKPIVCPDYITSDNSVVLITVANYTDYYTINKQMMDKGFVNHKDLFGSDIFLSIKKGKNDIILKCSTKTLFLKQYRNGELNRADVVVRYLAIEQFYGKNDYGLILYRKMQNLRKRFFDIPEPDVDKFFKLVKSIQLNDFSEDLPIKLMDNFELWDGSHRLALAIFFGIRYVAYQIVDKSRKVNYGYDFLSTEFSQDEISLISSKEKEILYKLHIYSTPEYHDYLSKVYTIFYSQNQKFGRGKLYQSFEKLQIEGQRPTEFRFRAYGLDKLLKKEHEVLDIGCNCGFLSLYVSQQVKNVIGIEYEQSLIDIANFTKEYLGYTNCEFYCADFNQYSTAKKFDVIFAFAVHHWINMPILDYSMKLASLLKNNGFVIIESQNIQTIDKDFNEKLNEFCGNRFKKIYGGEIFDDKNILRRFEILMIV
jgi:protein-L-isoaspartate O-methyltransferase